MKFSLGPFLAIIWDWNGTLLNDVDFSIEQMNVLLQSYALPRMSREKYLRLFRFPVINYYKDLGFNFNMHSWEQVGFEFMGLYWEGFNQLKPFSVVPPLLADLQKAGKRQFVLSAMEHNKLEHQIKINGLDTFFETVSGIDNHFATGKQGVGEELLKQIKVPKNKILLIGDTVHDLEVANNLGIQCVLVAQGHNSRERLLQVTNRVCNSLADLKV